MHSEAIAVGPTVVSAVSSRGTTGSLSRGGAMALLLLLVAPVYLLHISRASELSAVDEFVHVDYMVKAAAPDLIVDINTPISQRALREAACRGIGDDGRPEGVSCSSEHFDPVQFIWRGLNTGVTHGPVYYVITGVTARALAALPLTPDSIVTWGRVLGLVWFMAGTFFVFLSAELLGLRRSAVAASLTFIAMLPPVIGSFVAVNPDATAFGVGAALVWLALRYSATGRGIVALTAVAGLAILFDPTNALGAGLAGLIVLFYKSPSESVAPAGRSRLLAARSELITVAKVLVPMIAAILVVLFGWIAVYYMIVERLADVTDHPAEVAHSVTELTGDRFRQSWSSLVPPISVAWKPPVLRNGWLEGPWFNLSVYYMVTPLILSAIRFSRRDALSVVGLATGFMMVIGGPALVLHNYWLSDAYYPIPGRFGLSLLGGLALALAGLGQTRRGLQVLWFAGGAAVAATFVVLAV